MKIELQPQIEALLQAQVDSGLFGSIEEAVAAAVTTAYDDGASDVDLSWAKPFINQAEADIQLGRMASHDDVWKRVLPRRTSNG